MPIHWWTQADPVHTRKEGGGSQANPAKGCATTKPPKELEQNPADDGSNGNRFPSEPVIGSSAATDKGDGLLASPPHILESDRDEGCASKAAPPPSRCAARAGHHLSRPRGRDDSAAAPAPRARAVSKRCESADHRDHTRTLSRRYLVTDHLIICLLSPPG